jgi:uncharacterized RDD family membrane protein YckC
LDTDYAGFWPRVAASIVDSMIWTIPSWIIMILDKTGIVAVVLMLLYYAGFEGSKKQATWGKQVMYLRVAGKDGKRVSFWRALARVGLMLMLPLVFAFIIIFLYGIFSGGASKDDVYTYYFLSYFIAFLLDCLIIFWTPKQQALHDILSGCIIYKHDKKFEARLKAEAMEPVEPSITI